MQQDTTDTPVDLSTDFMITNPVKRLIDCIKNMGLGTGFRWWRLQNRCIKDPDFVLYLIEQSDKEAEEALEEKDFIKRDTALRWSYLMRCSYEICQQKQAEKIQQD